jgi:hypothetical protein
VLVEVMHALLKVAFAKNDLEMKKYITTYDLNALAKQQKDRRNADA